MPTSGICWPQVPGVVSTHYTPGSVGVSERRVGVLVGLLLSAAGMGRPVPGCAERRVGLAGGSVGGAGHRQGADWPEG